MAWTTINISNYSDALIVLGTAGVVVPMVRRFGLSPVLGYLGAGALLGPLGLGTFNQKYPALFWFTISDARNVDGIAELGIVFLLFLIGLELSLHRLLAMRQPYRAWRLAGAADHGAACRRRAAARPAGLGSGDPRRVPVAVVDGNRARIVVEPGASHHDRRPRQLFRAVRPGSRRHSDPDVHRDPGRRPRADRCSKASALRCSRP